MSSELLALTKHAPVRRDAEESLRIPRSFGRDVGACCEGPSLGAGGAIDEVGRLRGPVPAFSHLDAQRRGARAKRHLVRILRSGIGPVGAAGARPAACRARPRSSGAAFGAGRNTGKSNLADRPDLSALYPAWVWTGATLHFDLAQDPGRFAPRWRRVPGDLGSR